MADTSEDFSRAIARRLKKAREDSPYTVRALAEAAGIAPKTLQDYLHGRVPMRIPEWVRLCGLLGIDPKDLIEEVEQLL